jgi:predicted nucleotide-binding protein (sugar kinase/HSP70/actin superfamily)
MLIDTGQKFLKKLSAEHMWKKSADSRVPLTIGLPRMFFYHIYPDLWETFFSELGIKPIVSGPSTAKTVEKASQISETEHCLPNKLFDAHLAELVGKVDMVFVPRVLSTIKNHLSCPKFGPLPDAARADIARGTEVLSIDIDETVCPLSDSLMLLGKKLNMRRDRTVSAIERAFSAMEAAKKNTARPAGKKGRPHFLLTGHPYTIHDNFIAGPVLNKLASMGADVELISFADNTPSKSYILWSTANAIYHKLNTISADEYDGVIQLTVFNCGCDSMMIETYRQLVREKNIPYMYIMIDEHSAQAGVDTRVEAFIDSLRWRQ